MFPRLIRCAKTPVHVVILSEEANEYNERSTIVNKQFLCNYQDGAHIRRSADKQMPEVTGTVYIDGDIAPDAAVISCGYVVIFGARREISKGYKARNLDGSVNYTRLDVI